MTKKREVGQVSFSLRDPFEQSLYKHTKKYPNFSGYIKRLIQNDMLGHQIQLNPAQSKASPVKETTSSEFNPQLMKQFL